MVSVILEKRNQMITLDRQNLKEKIGDQPVIESVTPETIRMDLDSIGLMPCRITRPFTKGLEPEKLTRRKFNRLFAPQ